MAITKSIILISVTTIISIVIMFSTFFYLETNVLGLMHKVSNFTSSLNKSNLENITYQIDNNINISDPDNNIHTGEFNESKIALIKPTFTDAAYDNSFYIFFKKYAHVPPNTNVTTDLNLLNRDITNNPSGSMGNVYAMINLIKSLKWASNNTQTTELTDQDVDSGAIFTQKGDNLYDVVVLGHQEYVTQKEYDNLKKFVSNGGTMIILDGNVFYAEVKYFDKNNTISLVKGHAWAYNGQSAWKSVSERWKNETSQWVGSNYFCYQCIKDFKNNPFNYISHEEQYLTNPKDIILLNYNASGITPSHLKNITVATYELNYGKGKVIALGLYTDDIIKNGKFIRYFDNLLKYSLRND